jgi:hypothetical protein
VLGSVIIHDNAAMSDLFMPNAVWINRLHLKGNQPITNSSFERLAELRELVIENNGVLRDVPALPALASIDNVRIADNFELTTLTGLATLGFANEIDISHNTNLATIDLSGLQSAEGLYVYQNPALDGPSVAEAVAGASITRSRVAPNQDILPIEPCPWTEDDYCDGDPINRWAPEYRWLAMCRTESDPVCSAE